MAKKSFIALTGLVIVAVAVWLVWLQPTSSVPVPLPSPNGYDDLLKAGRLYVERSLTNWNYWELDHERLRAIVRPNAEALKWVRMGLNQKSRVPVEYSETYADNIIRDLAPIRHLTIALRTEELLAVMEHRTNDAVTTCLDFIRLSRAASCGGLVLHAMNGQTLELFGVSGLQRLTNGLDASACREIIKALELLEAKRESPEEILRRERESYQKSYGVMTRIKEIVTNRSFDRTASYRVGFVKRANDQQRETGLLLIDLAARAFELEKGRRPQSAKELVPDYLKAVPKNPTTGADLALPK